MSEVSVTNHVGLVALRVERLLGTGCNVSSLAPGALYDWSCLSARGILLDVVETGVDGITASSLGIEFGDMTPSGVCVGAGDEPGLVGGEDTSFGVDGMVDCDRV